MKKIMDKLFNNIKFDKRYVFFSILLVIIGIIAGSFFIIILNENDKSLVMEYINTFVFNIKNNNTNNISILKDILINNYLTIIIISVLGFTYIFTFLNIIILFYKSFIIGFSLSSFILVYKTKGVLLSIIYIFPHYIINILLFSVLTAFTLKLSFNMIKHIIKKKEVNMRSYFNKYIYTVIFICIIITLTSIYEAYVASYLFKLIVNFII